jgi:hypothetical protein
VLALAPGACGGRSTLELFDEVGDAPASFGGRSLASGAGGSGASARAGAGPGSGGVVGAPSTGGVAPTGGAVATGGTASGTVCAGKACAAPLVCHEERCIDPSLYLRSLSVTADSEELVQFDRERVRYAAIAKAEADGVTIRAVPESSSSVVRIDGESGGVLAVTLGPELRRTIEVVVENPLGQTRVHEVLLIREGVEEYVRAASPVAYSELGGAVALSGDTLAVGAPGPASGDPPPGVERPTGYVVILRYVNSEWVEEARIEAEVPTTGDGFGDPIALDGDTLVVGAPYTLPVGSSGYAQGAAYVYQRVGRTWSLSATLSPSSATDYGLEFGSFGNSVAVHDRSVAIGIPGAGATSSTTGAVAVFTNESGSWTPSVVLPEEGQAGFGTSVALGVNAMGAPRLVVGAGTAQTVHVLEKSNGAWDPIGALEAPSWPSGSNFGSSLALSDDTIAVAADYDSSEGAGVNPQRTDDPFDGVAYSGAVYVYRETPDAWVEEAHIKSPIPRSYGYFGWAVALHHDTLVVGARQETGPGRGPTVHGPDLEPPPASTEAEATGSVTVFQRRQGVWREEIYFKTPRQLGTFGASVAVSQDFLAVGSQADSGATSDSDSGLPYSGGVFIWPWQED